MTLFKRVANCYFCEKEITEGTKTHVLGGDGDSKLQCHSCYNRAAKLRCKKRKLEKRKLRKRNF